MFKAEELIGKRLLYDRRLSQRETDEGRSPVTEIRLLEISPSNIWVKVQWLLLGDFGWFDKVLIENRIMEVLEDK